MARAKVGIIGAGPGGLACGMLLAHNGFEVTVFEKEARVGGRNAAIREGGYTFDTGPTFLMMKFLLDELFQMAGRDSSKCLHFARLEPMYQLNFADGETFSPTTDKGAMENEIRRLFPNDAAGLSKFYAREKIRYESLAPCLKKDYSSFAAFFTRRFIGAIPHMFTGGSVFENLGNYFRSERLRLCFTFQSKYLGMSAWECPGAFTMIPFVEHEFGIYHVQGGLNQISEAMAKAIMEDGGKIRLNCPVSQVLMEGGKAKGAILQDGSREDFDEIVVNADFGHAMSSLFPKGAIKKYSQENLKGKKFSCSTFMLYLGVGKKYSLPHHSIYFAEKYRENVEDIFNRKRLSKDISFYVQNASATDPTLAPKGKSAIYVLVPVPNNSSGIDWAREAPRFRELVLNTLEKRTPMKDLRKHIEVEHAITPADWESGHAVHMGATFNLSHNLMQMLYFRPHNKFEEAGNCYLVGGGTHPGSGLPTIYESGRISAELIMEKHKH